uniref:Regulator of G-protein signaling 1 n=1 Tax=Pundamilia nyererei TaxID=303518 RepID=A0A3B4EU30_9CICH
MHHNAWQFSASSLCSLPSLSLRALLGGKENLVFEDFLRTEYSDENLLFWLACKKYKKITRVTEMTIAAKRIYTEFVQVGAPRQINIDCVTREEISKNISQPGPNCFDGAQKLIYGLMENDCYPRFLKSEIYQDLLEPDLKAKHDLNNVLSCF